MHAIIAVIHEDPVFNESNFSKFCWDNEEYYERNYITDNIEESITKVEEYEKYLRDNINKDIWYGEKLTALLAKESDLDRIKFYAENEYQEIDENGCLYENGIPLVFVIGLLSEEDGQICCMTIMVSDIIHCPYQNLMLTIPIH